MLPIISNKIVIMIAHSADMSTTALQHVHGACWLHCWCSIMPTVSTVRYTLIFHSNVRYFRKESWLVIYIHLVLVVDDI